MKIAVPLSLLVLFTVSFKLWYDLMSVNHASDLAICWGEATYNKKHVDDLLSRGRFLLKEDPVTKARYWTFRPPVRK